jgi:outer membrane lipoprotein-sorting protein
MLIPNGIWMLSHKKSGQAVGSTVLFSLIFTLWGFFSTTSGTIAAMPKATHSMSNDPQKILLQYSKAVESIQTLFADIVQTNPNGSVMTAKLYLQRPVGKAGEMRLVYNPPSKIEIMAAKNLLVHYDGHRDHSQSMALANSPVAFLLLGNLHDHVILIQIIRHAPYTTLIMKSKKDPNAGSIHLTFNDMTMKNPKLFPLVGWSIHDSYGKITHIALKNARKDIPMPKGAFEFRKK